jgi:hypothetical protein
MPYLVIPPITYHHSPLYIVVANRGHDVHHKLFQVRVVSGDNPSVAMDFPIVPLGPA